MRARDFILVEYKRDVTIKNYYRKLINHIYPQRTSIYKKINGLDQTPLTNDEQQDINNSFDTILDIAERADPTSNKQYVQWIVKGYVSGFFRDLEDIESTAAEFLTMWHELQMRRKLPAGYSDINQIKDSKIWAQAYTDIFNVYEKLKDAENTDANPRGNAKTVFENDELRIVHPEDQKAACYYGRGTQWCTAATRGKNMFDQYNKDGPMYIIIPKNPDHQGEKFQVHAASGQIMDETDDSVMPHFFFGRFDTNVRELLRKLDPQWKKYYHFADQEDVNKVVKYYFDQIPDAVDHYIEEHPPMKKHRKKLIQAATIEYPSDDIDEGIEWIQGEIGSSEAPDLGLFYNVLVGLSTDKISNLENDDTFLNLFRGSGTIPAEFNNTLSDLMSGTPDFLQ